MVTLNLPHDNLTSMIQIFYCFGLMGSYPIQMFPVFQILERANWYKRWQYLCKWRLGWTKTYLMRTVCAILTLLIAISIPKFGLFVNLIGAMAGTILAFIMPIYIYNKAFENEMTKKLYFWHSALVAFGVSVGMVASTISLYELILWK